MTAKWLRVLLVMTSPAVGMNSRLPPGTSEKSINKETHFKNANNHCQTTWKHK